LHFADQIEIADEISFDRVAMALRARRRRTLHAITLSEAPLALSPSAETARVLADGLVGSGLDKLAVVKTAAAMARSGDVLAQGGTRGVTESVARSVRRCARGATRGLADAGALRQTFAEGVFPPATFRMH